MDASASQIPWRPWRPGGFLSLGRRELLQSCEEVDGRFRFEAKALAGPWVNEAEQARVQRLVPEPFAESANAGVRRGLSVERIAENRRAAFGEVHADLVR